MKKYVALTVLALTAVGVIASHLDIEQHDDSYLLRVDGARFDVRGHVSAYLNQLTRRCAAVQGHTPDEPMAQAVKRAISDFSPPDSRGLNVRQISTSGSWVLAEVEFPQLQPAVILLNQKAQEYTIDNGLIWSGTADPWLAGPWIRRYLQQRAPQVPDALLACFDPTKALFGLK
jgi:hypothetical protein